MPDFTNLNTNAFDNLSWESSKSSKGSKKVDRKIVRLLPDRPARVRFVTDPSGMKIHPDLCYFTTKDNTWAKYREARAWDGCKGDIEPTHIFIPVMDYEITHTGARRNRKDPLQEQIRPSDADIKKGLSYASAKDIMLVNVIFEPLKDERTGEPYPTFNKNADYDPKEGEMVILALSPAQAKALSDEMQTASKYTDFSFTEGLWTLIWNNPNKSNPSTWNLRLERDTNVPPLDTIPEIIDPLPILTEIRAMTELEVFGVGAVADDGGFSEEIVAAAEEQADTDEAPESNTRRSPAYVKGMLRKAGVNVPVRITNEDLYALATEHGVSA